MNQIRRPLLVKLLLVMFTLIIINESIYSRIILNRGDEAFENLNTDGKSVTIQSCIIDGAGYYMKAYSDILLFLQGIEWSTPENVNYDELKNLVTRAIDNMKNAEGVYTILEEMANATSYNPAFIEKLTAFDYSIFQQERAAEGTAFSNTRKYLAAGDVRGLFTHIKTGTGDILNMLMDIRAAFDAEKFPALSSLWRLNQLFSETMLFGQYAAEVFYEAGGYKE
jgi:hypothetical protein